MKRIKRCRAEREHLILTWNELTWDEKYDDERECKGNGGEVDDYLGPHVEENKDEEGYDIDIEMWKVIHEVPFSD